MEDLSRRRFVRATGATTAAVAGGLALSTSASAHAVGSAVYTTDDLNVRSGPGLDHDVIATADQYTGMYVEGGPWSADGYTWWRVRTNGDGNNGRFEGYAVEQYTAHADVSYPATGYLSSTYYDSRDYGYHSAIDVANSTGTNVLAARGGTATTHWGSSCGNYVVVDHGGGYETLYCHLDSFAVSDGEQVSRHEHLGEMGETGHATGPHVHFEVNYDGDEVYVAGDPGEQVYARTGVPKNYDGL